MKTLLFTNAGRRATLLKNVKQSLGDCVRLLATDNWAVAPALFMADDYFLMPKFSESGYIESLLRLCRKENVDMLTSLIDPEITLLAEHRRDFEAAGVALFCPDQNSAELCFDKYRMASYLEEKGIRTPFTLASLDAFRQARAEGRIDFPVFVKPRTGSGSVGCRRVDGMEALETLFHEAAHDYIIQELMRGEDCDADVYFDTLTHRPVAAFAKRKLETRIGGASKTISFKDPALFALIREIGRHFNFFGPVDMDFFCVDGRYYLNEVNPRFGGAYLHAYGAGVDFPKLIENNLAGRANPDCIGDYEEGLLMLMYDDVLFVHERDLRGNYRD